MEPKEGKIPAQKGQIPAPKGKIPALKGAKRSLGRAELELSLDFFGEQEFERPKRCWARPSQSQDNSRPAVRISDQGVARGLSGPIPGSLIRFDKV